MAGRPLTKAKRFADWEDRLWGMLAELSDLMPRAASRQREDDPDFWRAAFRLLERATIAAAILRFELEDRAGLDAEALQAKRERARGLWGDETGDAATVENAHGATA